MSTFTQEGPMYKLKRSMALLPCVILTAACSHTMPQYTAKPVPLPQYSAPTLAALQTPPSQLP
ncbi:MAG TPA: hypothetical protein VL329_09140, partial [Nitrospiraceae bacterium]|nr:hypothetical protein [Nitrospiraceae bacterium]